MDIHIKKLTSEDIDDIYRLESAYFSMIWSKENLGESFKTGMYHMYGAYIGGELAGYINLHYVAGDLTIDQVAVYESFRRQGIAEMLINHGISQFPEAEYMLLEVRESNAPARHLYDKFGFKTVGIRKDYYEKPAEDALIMVKSLI